MQDRFKFRFWDKTKKIMIADYVTDEQWKYICSQYTEKEWYWNVELGLTTVLDYFDDKNTVIMQCTGLKDKNGKLIYEGDVVNLEYFDYDTKYRKAIVEWEDNGYCVIYIKPTDTKVTGSDLTSWFPKVEVIGNIYEQPELLGVQK